MSMKIGFQLKGSGKRKILTPAQGAAGEDGGVETQREVILSIEGNEVKGVNEAKGPLVIPLQAPLNAAPSAPDPSLDELAAKELLADINAPNAGPKDSGLVIEGTGLVAAGGKKQPLLLANVPPELLQMTDDHERYRLDMSMRPADIDAKSDAYRAVPIEEFGAALLRGMGWEGPTAESEEKDKKGYELVVRESRLGLGATAKPPDPDSKKSKNGRGEKGKEEWKKKAEESMKKQQLQVGDTVWLRDPLYAGQSARVEAVRGVPGLDRIRVSLLEAGNGKEAGVMVEVKRLDAVLMAAENDSREVSGEVELNQPESSKRSRHSPDRSSRKHDGCRSDDGRRSRRTEEDADRDKKRSRRDYADNRVDGSGRGGDGVSRAEESRRRESSRSNEVFSQKPNKNVTWVREGIKVRVISDKVKALKLDCYLKKFNVVSIDHDGLVTLKLITDDKNPAAIKVEHVKEKYLENVLPPINGKCMILVGESAGRRGILLEKDKQNQKLVISVDSSASGEGGAGGRCKEVKVSFDGAAAMSD